MLIKTLTVISFLLLSYKTLYSQRRNGFFFGDTVSIQYFSDTTIGFPKEILIIGKITDFSAGPSCGVIAGSGVLKLLLLNRITGYNHEFIYLVVPCFSGGKEFINKMIFVSAKALYKNDPNCYNPVLNKFDSNGIPFYIISEKDRSSIYR